MVAHQSRRQLPLRVCIALVVLVAVALIPTISIVAQLGAVLPRLWPRSDAITEFERRLAPLSAAVRDEAIVGYLSSSGPGQLDPAELAEFYLIQYSLAPVIVVNNPRRPLVVGNAILDPSQPRLGVPEHLEILRHFGHGLVLLQARH